MPSPSPTTRCALTAPFQLYLCPERPSAVYFLWHFPAGYPGWPLATTMPYPARTFLWPKKTSDRQTHTFNLLLIICKRAVVNYSRNQVDSLNFSIITCCIFCVTAWRSWLFFRRSASNWPAFRADSMVWGHFVTSGISSCLIL
jgi:hypothetical protein